MEDRTVVQSSNPGSVKPGVQLNGVYEVEQLIAYGGMGEVYRGFNIQTREAVAIKMIRPEFASDPENFELFRREATILNSVVHDAIVRYFVFSVDPVLRRAYLAIEFVDGPSLTSRLEKGPLPPDEVRILQKRIGAALDAAHRRGIVHRDISPDNIILPEGEVRNAKVIDFGIARSLKRADASIIGGRFAGKTNYASPEQFGLAGGDVTAKSDIYSFGLVLAAALRGRPIDMGGTEVETIGKRAATPDLAGIDPSFRPLLEAMLQPLPANRPASMADVAAWEPPPAAAPKSAKALIPPSTRQGSGGAGGGGRAAAIAAAAIVILSLGGLAYVFRDELAGKSGRADSPPAVASSEAPKEPPAAGAAPAEAVQTPSAGGSSPPPLTPAASPAAADAPQVAAMPPAAESAPTVQTAPQHVVTADELVAATQSPATEPAPVAQASPPPAPPAKPVPVPKPAPIVQPPAAEPLPAAAEKPPTSVAKAPSTAPEPEKPAPSLSPAAPAVAAPPPAIAAKPDAQPALAPEPVKTAKLETQPPPAASADPAKAFVAGFDGGDCFFVTPRAGATAPNAYQAAGIDIGPFQRFDAGFKQAVGAEADINVALIAPPECPALDLARLGATDGAGAPRIELTRDEVGRGKPLAGKVANLGGRHLYLLLARSDGTASRIEAKVQPGGDTATFSAALTAEAAAVGPMQVLIAIASDKPAPALESFRSGPLKAIAAKVADEAREAAASAGAGYFKFVN